MQIRPRILRKSAATRSLVRETTLGPQDIIVPLFVTEGDGKEETISSMTGYMRRSVDKTVEEVGALRDMGFRAVLLFVKVPEQLKDNAGTEALNEEGLMQQSVRAIKAAFPDMVVMTDVALDPYSSFGHDGIVEDGEIVNDATVEVLAQMAVSHAQAGADIVAPSDMMDGRITAIRTALEVTECSGTGIMAYSAKYASCFYGPFRDALDSAPGFGDKKTYQMDPANAKEALLEASLDLEEGADILMVKPAGPYLDIVHRVSEMSYRPVAAYQVSGEYAMIHASSANGWLDFDSAVAESLVAIKRAGADLIATYFAKDIHKILKW